MTVGGYHGWFACCKLFSALLDVKVGPHPKDRFCNAEKGGRKLGAVKTYGCEVEARSALQVRRVTGRLNEFKRGRESGRVVFVVTTRSFC